MDEFKSVFIFRRLELDDLLHFAPKMELTADRAAALFDRLCDGDRLLSEAAWDRVGALLSHEGLVRAEGVGTDILITRSMRVLTNYTPQPPEKLYIFVQMHSPSYVLRLFRHEAARSCELPSPP